jgi:Bacteriophage N adsorption protein A C-term
VRKSGVAAIMIGLFAGSIAEPFLFDRGSWQAFAEYPYLVQSGNQVTIPAKIYRMRVTGRRIIPPEKISLQKSKFVSLHKIVSFSEGPLQSVPMMRKYFNAPSQSAPDPAIDLFASYIGPVRRPPDGVRQATRAIPVADAQPGRDTKAAPRLHITAAISWHPNVSGAFATNSGAALGNPYVGLEISHQLNRSQSHPLRLSLSQFTALGARGSPDFSTTQMAVGLRYKPLENINAVVGIERLIRVGDQSRNDWAVSFAADRGVNYDGPVDKSYWPHWHVAANGAIIGTTSPDLFTSAEARAGIGLSLNDTWQITPHFGAQLLLQLDGKTQSRIEAGPGIWLRGRLFDSGLFDSGRIDSGRIDFRVGYAVGIGGTVASQNGVRVQMAVSY